MRVKYLVHPKIQIKFLVQALMLNISGLIIFAGALYYFFKNYENAAHTKGLPPDHLFFSFMKNQQEMMLNVFLVVVFLSSVVTIIYSIMNSHKFIGPLHKMQKQLNKDTWEPIILRKDDVLYDLSLSINAAMEKSKQK
ncbi:MAG: hypothetical protein JNL11_13365 [Bdellovibrionaceae bacterium]|nr:hypothetical protein [Pseudobdellovibrionaceae bacterium]